MIKVLVVEDEKLIREGIVHTIDWASLGCIVSGEAANGEDGLKMAEKYDPELIITDIKMPKLDGIEMLRRLRERGCTAQVIILTAYDTFQYAQSALRLGSADYLLKPFRDGELEQVITRLRPCLEEADGRKKCPAPPPLPDPGNGPGRNYAAAAIDYIRRHYNDPDISIGDVARHLGLSEGHLSHLFKKKTGCTLSACLTRQRIRRATELLHDCRTRIGEVAAQTGYRDVAYFSATFKKIMGISPSEYQSRSRSF